MNGRTPDLDPATAHSELEDADFGDEHTRPTVADEQAVAPDESEPDGRGGDGGMDPA